MKTEGDTAWPWCGEVDILEIYGSKNGALLECDIHFATDNLTSSNQ